MCPFFCITQKSEIIAIIYPKNRRNCQNDDDDDDNGNTGPPILLSWLLLMIWKYSVSNISRIGHTVMKFFSIETQASITFTLILWVGHHFSLFPLRRNALQVRDSEIVTICAFSYLGMKTVRIKCEAIFWMNTILNKSIARWREKSWDEHIDIHRYRFNLYILYHVKLTDVFSEVSCLLCK